MQAARDASRTSLWPVAACLLVGGAVVESDCQDAYAKCGPQPGSVWTLQLVEVTPLVDVDADREAIEREEWLEVGVVTEPDPAPDSEAWLLVRLTAESAIPPRNMALELVRGIP